MRSSQFALFSEHGVQSTIYFKKLNVISILNFTKTTYLLEPTTWYNHSLQIKQLFILR